MDVNEPSMAQSLKEAGMGYEVSAPPTNDILTAGRSVRRRRRFGIIVAGVGIVVATGTGINLAKQMTGDTDATSVITALPTDSPEYKVALQVAQDEASQLDGRVKSASVVVVENHTTSTNTGYRCTSDHVLNLRLIGDFSLGVGGDAAQTDNVGKWVAADYIVDPKSAQICLRSVDDAPHLRPLPGSTILFR